MFNIFGICLHLSIKNQLKKADKSGATIAVVLGEDEVKNQSLTIKFLREQQPQQTLPLESSIALFAKVISGVCL